MERISKDIRIERVVSEIKIVENVLEKGLKQRNGQIIAIVNVILSAIISGIVVTIPKLVFALCGFSIDESVISFWGYIFQLLIFCLLIFIIPKCKKAMEIIQSISNSLYDLEEDNGVDTSEFSIRQVTEDVRYYIFPLIVGAYDCATVAMEVKESSSCRIMNFMWGSEKLSKVISMLYDRCSTLEEIVLQFSRPECKAKRGPLPIVSADTLSLYEIEQMLALIEQTIALIRSAKKDLINHDYNSDFDTIQENGIDSFMNIKTELKDLITEITMKNDNREAI